MVPCLLWVVTKEIEKPKVDFIHTASVWMSPVKYLPNGVAGEEIVLLIARFSYIMG